MIFVSHDVDEVREITDPATIQRDGKVIDTVVTRDIGHDAFVQRIIGRSMAEYGGGSKARLNAAPLVRVEIWRVRVSARCRCTLPRVRFWA